MAKVCKIQGTKLDDQPVNKIRFLCQLVITASVEGQGEGARDTDRDTE